MDTKEIFWINDNESRWAFVFRLAALAEDGVSFRVISRAGTGKKIVETYHHVYYDDTEDRVMTDKEIEAQIHGELGGLAQRNKR